MGAVKPLDVFLEENHIPRRTFYDWKDRGIAPRTIKIGRGVFITAEDESEWVERHRSAAAALENAIADLTFRLAEAAVELAGAPTASASAEIIERATAIARELIAARASRAQAAGDGDCLKQQDADRVRLDAVTAEAVQAARAVAIMERARIRR